jgi:ABC-type multidrug transport system permease subunit
VEGLSVNELQYITVECNDADLIKFLPPPGATCGNYTSNYFANGAPGYLVNPEAMQPELCGYCNFKTGKEFYSTFEWDESNRWRDFGVIIAFFIFNTICFGLLVYWKRKAKR